MQELLLCAYDYDQYNNKISVMLAMNFFKIWYTWSSLEVVATEHIYPRSVLYVQNSLFTYISCSHTYIVNNGLYITYNTKILLLFLGQKILFDPFPSY